MSLRAGKSICIWSAKVFSICSNNLHYDLFIICYLDSIFRCTHPKFPTIMDCLQVSNPAVLNTLIDQKQIEQILLIDSEREAQQLLSRPENVPRNCKFAYTLGSGSGSNQYFPAPSYRYSITCTVLSHTYYICMILPI